LIKCLDNEQLDLADSMVISITDNEFRCEQQRIEVVGSENFTSPAVFGAAVKILAKQCVHGHAQKRDDRG
jgi:glycine/serine hydroxymethyltransferase